ncbi:hypothetical protein HYFRA_00002828, partial [Hymenoscyphus fraxineus]
MADPLSVAGSIAGLVAIAGTVYTRTYRYIKNVKNSEKEIAQLASEIGSLSGLLHSLGLFIGELQRNTTSETNFRLHHIHACRETLTKVEKKLDSKDPAAPGHSWEERLIKKLKWPFSMAETRELIVEVERHKSTVNIALSADTLSTVFQALSRQNKMAEDISDLKSQLKSRWAMDTHITLGRERKQILDYFGKVDSTLNHQANLKLRHPLTGLWVTEGEMFRSWLRIRNSKLWLSGVAGGGKTVLAASLIEEAMDDSSSNQAVAYFYCDYRDPEKQTPMNIIGSLAAQLARQAEEAFTLLQKLYKTCHPEDRAFFLPDISQLITTMLEMSSHFEEVSIIVDGLDECGTNTITVIELLNKLVSNHQSNVRLLVLSREDLGIREVLEKEFTYLEISAQSKDLELYVAAELEARKGAGRGRLRIRSTELKEHIMKTLVERAAGMFRWVSCQIDFLCELPTDAEKRKALTILPPTLYGTYERILDGVNRSGQAVQKMVQTTLNWVVSSEGGSLSLDELCEAISIRPGDKSLDKEALYDEETILSHCSSLVQVNHKLEGFELSHFTVKEFLTTIDPNSPYFQYSQNKKEVSSSLAKTCLAYVMLEPFQSDVIEDLDEWCLQQNEHPFRIHAVRYWFTYAKHNWTDVQMFALTQELFDSSKTLPFLSWARDYLFLHSSPFAKGEEDQRKIFDRATDYVLAGGVEPLHIAAAMGAYEVCQWLLSSGCQINQLSDLGTPLHCALMGIDILSEFFEDFEWFSTYSEGQYEAYTRIETLRLLVDKGADFNKPYIDPYDEEYSCVKLALHTRTADSSNHPLTLLVEAGAKLDKDLLIAFQRLVEDNNHAFSDDKDAYQKFIETLVKNFEQNTQDDEVKHALLDIALQFKTFSGLPQIGLENDSFARLPQEELQAKFLRAIRFDQTSMMELLLRGSSLKPSFTHGSFEETPLHEAVYWKSSNAIKLLISLGAKVDAADYEGYTPLHVAACSVSRDNECASILLDNGSSLTAVDKSDHTPWHVAAKYGSKAALMLFLSRDEQLDQSLATREKEGFIPLFYAAKHQSIDALEILIPQYSDLSQKCPLGVSLVHYVAGMDSMTLLRLLQDKGLSLHQRTADGRTALHFIPRDVDPAVVRFLIDNGVNPNTTTKDGESPLHRLLRDEISSDLEVIELLATEEVISSPDKDGNLPVYYALAPSVTTDKKNEWQHTRTNFVQLLKRREATFTTCNTSGESSLRVLLRAYPPPITSLDSFETILICIVESTTNVESLNELHVHHWYNNPGDNLQPLINIAIANKCSKLTELLLSKDVDVDVVAEPNKWSPVFLASYAGIGIDLYQKILAKSKKINYCNAEGLYLPHAVCMQESSATELHLKALRDLGVDIDVPTSNAQKTTPLMLASQSGKSHLVKWLLGEGVDFSVKDGGGCLAVHYACLGSGYLVLLEFEGLSIQWGSLGNVYLNNIDIGGRNVLHLAACSVPICLQIVLEKGFWEDINSLTTKGESALHLAAMLDKFRNVEQLLAAGANIEVVSTFGLRPIHTAASFGHPKTVETLLSHHCGLSADSNGLTPEMHALSQGHIEIASIIGKKRIEKNEASDGAKAGLPQTSDSDAISNSLSMSLESAIRRGDLDSCKSIVKAGVDLNRRFRTCKGCSPVLKSLGLGQYGIARYLIKEGATTLGQACTHLFSSLGEPWSWVGHSAVHLACREESPKDILSLLLKEDRKAGFPAFRGPVSPLHVAVACENLEAIKLILEQQLYEDTPSNFCLDQAENTQRCSQVPKELQLHPLHQAQIGPSIIDLCIDRRTLKWGWVLSDRQTKGLTTSNIHGTALHLAVFVRSFDITKILLEHGAKANSVDHTLQTPLHLAAIHGLLDIFKLLVQYGSNPFASTRDGRTAISMALESKVPSSFNIVSLFDSSSLRHPSSTGCNLLHAASSSPSKFSYLFYQGLDPYDIPSIVFYNPIERALIKSQKGDRPHFISLLCNLRLDFGCCTDILWDRSYMDYPISKLKLLIKCLPRSKIAVDKEYDEKSRECAQMHPLSIASHSGRVDLLELLI